MKSLASSFFMFGRIRTTEAKAKELKPLTEKMLTRAKTPTVANIRHLRKFFPQKVVKKIIERSKDFKGRSGGYTRIVKLGRRRGDGAKMAYLELVK